MTGLCCITGEVERWVWIKCMRCWTVEFTESSGRVATHDVRASGSVVPRNLMFPIAVIHPHHQIHPSGGVSSFSHIMIQQRVSRSLQHIARQQQRQCARLRQQQTPPSVSSPFRLFAPLPIQGTYQQRCYSSAAEAAAGKQGQAPSEGASEEQLKAEEATQTSQAPNDASQKELEAKKKEVIEITVRPSASM